MKLIKLFLLVSLLACLASCKNTSEEINLRQKIDASIPLGSSKDRVIQFLSENSLNYLIDQRLPRSPRCPDCLWIPAYTEKSDIWGRKSIHADFFFDKRTEKLTIYETSTNYKSWFETS